ncbi:glycerol-3-phosphate responsive antiterminator [Cetobacterium sp. 2A]|uniref:glycerol-3-phosphate responsive antiterminator n=1 Tax=unclassified Cetobacterium TaxID=2630983 RepID=UPI00163CCA42|nr:glycerol-3-phosphate responsive antiterminator [Cetobacterium sp. 2A]MBC2855095.1 glycerol-3-phosphate responsive antiterminator [Cetobacterium sp. 2A]
MRTNFGKILTENKIIIAVKNLNDLDAALKTDSKIIFLLCGDICTLEEATRKIKSAGKISFLHIDMVEGINSKDQVALDFLKENSFADGIITTRTSTAKYAKKIGFLVIQRCFLIDSLSFENTQKILKECELDAVEILPGVMPKIIKKLSSKINIPLIAGGLISDKEDVEVALKSGAKAVSTTKLNITL